MAAQVLQDQFNLPLVWSEGDYGAPELKTGFESVGSSDENE